MAHVGKASSSGSMEPQLAPLPPRTGQAPARVHVKPAHQATGHEHIAFVPTGNIDGLAGVRQGLQPRLSELDQYAAVSMRLAGQRYVPMRRARAPLTERKVEQQEEEEGAFLEAVRDALDLLGEDSGSRNRDELEAQLARYFTPVQRLKVIVQSLQKLDSENRPERQKLAMGRALNGMITALMKKHPHEIRAVLHETEEAGGKLDPLSEPLQSSVRLRMLIGAKDSGKFDIPLSPLTVLKALIKNFGGDCVFAMCSLRSRMMSGL